MRSDKSMRFKKTRQRDFSLPSILAVFAILASMTVGTGIWSLGATNSVQAATKDCSLDQVGFTPLIDLGAGFHQREQGGLYPGASNNVPMTHLDLGLQLSSQVEPLAPDETPDSGAGSIVLISIGVSNTTQEFAIGASEGVPGTPFKARADADPDKNSQLAIVDGAQGGHAISHWLDTSFSPWVEVANGIAAAGFSPLQVQAAWVKLPERNPTEAFPIDAQTYRDDLETVLRDLKSEYPNIQLAYLSSRVYGGYSVNSPSPEPFAYQMGFGVKLTIQDQINGLGNINPDPAQGEVVAPWVAWGPYIWADGVNPNSDGLTWLCEDFVSDGTHPGGSAVDKVAIRLLDHFKTDPTSFLGSWLTAAQQQQTMPTVSGRIAFSPWLPPGCC